MQNPTKRALPPKTISSAAQKVNRYLLDAAEKMNNILAAENQPEQPVQPCIRLSISLKKDLETHYQNMKKRATSSWRRDFLKSAMLEVLGPNDSKWENEQKFRERLAKECGVSESALRNDIFPDRKRPSLLVVNKLLEGTKKTDNEYFLQFGWNPKEENLEIRYKKLKDLLSQKWGLNKLDKAAPYLLLSPSTLGNIQTVKCAELRKEDSDNHQKKKKIPCLEVSTAFHFIIALAGTSEEEMTDLFHLFGLEPILPEEPEAWGEADGVVKIAAAAFDSLHQALGVDNWESVNLERGSVQFFTLLFLLLKDMDPGLSGLLFRQMNLQLKDEIENLDADSFFNNDKSTAASSAISAQLIRGN